MHRRGTSWVFRGTSWKLKSTPSGISGYAIARDARSISTAPGPHSICSDCPEARAVRRGAGGRDEAGATRMTTPAQYRSELSFRNRLGRACWGIVWGLFCRLSPRPLHGWRRMWVRLFGARVHATASIYPSARVWAPWNLEMGARSALGDAVDCYDVDRIIIEEDAIVSQYAFLCTASHDIADPGRRLTTAPIRLGRHSWICAGAFVHRGARGDHARRGSLDGGGRKPRQARETARVARRRRQCVSHSVDLWSSVELGAFLRGLVRGLGDAGFQARHRFAVTEERYRAAKGRWGRARVRWSSYVSYPWHLRRQLRGEKAPDAVVVCTNTFYAPAIAMQAAGGRAPVINWVFDLFPDVLVAGGKVAAGGLVESRLGDLTRATFRRAAANVFLGDRLRRYAEDRYGPIPRSHVIPVVADEDGFGSTFPGARAAGEPLSVLYCGNLGCLFVLVFVF